MIWFGIPYFLVVLCHVWTSGAIGLAKRLVWHISKYLILAISRPSGQLVAFLGLGLDKSVCWESCEYQSCSKLLKLSRVKIWWHLA
jgi:hypothetical protein